MSDFSIDELEIFTEESDKKDFYDSDGALKYAWLFDSSCLIVSSTVHFLVNWCKQVFCRF